jgi:hypothetical protein
VTQPGSSSANHIDLREVFGGHEAALGVHLSTGANAGHRGVQGDGNEQHWIDLFERHLPRRYAITRAMVVDSRGGQSEQLDLVIYDRQYSPEFWQHGDHHYLPAESVYAVFEIKPELNREYVLYAGGKIASVRRLHRTSASFEWASGTHPGRQDFRPLGGILCAASGWSPMFGDPFNKALGDVVVGGGIDFGCVLGGGAFEISDPGRPTEFTTSDSSVALVGFLMTLLRRLQQIGTAPAIDYTAYEGWISGKAPQAGSDP